MFKELVDFDYSRLINNQIYVGRMLFQLSQLSSIEQMTTLNNEFKHNINNITSVREFIYVLTDEFDIGWKIILYL